MALYLYLFPFLQSGYNVRIKEIHFLNAPSFADILITMFKSTMKSKLTKRVRTDLVAYFTHNFVLSKNVCIVICIVCFVSFCVLFALCCSMH